LIVLSAEKIGKSFSEKPLLRDVSFFLDRDDKVGVIGVNGTGKSTFLNILAGKEAPDAGRIIRTQGTTVSYLEQNPAVDENLSLIQNVFQDSDENTKQIKEYEAKAILTKLGFSDVDMSARDLSGGEKKRVAIARALVNPCDVLILDEPTNHLDNQMVLWLENYLKSYSGAVVMVTHDRYFLDRVANRIVEIDGGVLYAYSGNYSRFLELKAQREEMDAATLRKNRSLFRKELEWMRRGARARGTKSKSRIERFESLSDGLAAPAEKLKMDSVSTRLGRKTIEAIGLSKSFGGRCLVRDFSYNIMRDARVGIIGDNGSGKSTLMKMLAGALRPDTGEVVRGDTVKIGYLSQEWDAPPEHMRVIDYIKETGGEIATNDGTISASKMLERFLFPPDLQWNPVSKLSGGEKRRLYLLKILMEAPNILFLDEPTNDLDIETLTILEDYLESFSGAVVTISHDRYFLDKVVNTIFELRDGALRQYNGGYSDYLDVAIAPEEKPADKPPPKPGKARAPKSAKLKFTFAEGREFEAIDGELEALEEKFALVKEEIERNASDYEKLAALLAEKELIEAELSGKMERWVYLNELAEEIKANQ
jgi:ATP-binding cassette subfamily F protein uup